MNNWQPIETAPRDGKWVMVHYSKYCVPAIVFYERDRWLGSDIGTNKPTHWMPLPAPPSDEGG